MPPPCSTLFIAGARCTVVVFASFDFSMTPFFRLIIACLPFWETFTVVLLNVRTAKVNKSTLYFKVKLKLFISLSYAADIR